MNSGVLSFYRKLVAIALVLSVIVICALNFSTSVNAVAGTNKQLNFQGRLFNAQGATVPDGYYNIEFKIYQDGDGLTAGNTTGTPAGTLKWTEDYLNNNGKGVVVKNGFMSVQLGSVNAFGNNIDWNQDTLWLSMNIAGTNATCATFAACSPDGEMVPMKRLSSAAYALNSSQLNGLSSAQFLQLAQGVQTDASTNTSSIFVNKTSTGNLLQLQSSGNDAFTLNNSGDIIFGSSANHTISVATAADSAAGKTLTVSAGNGGTGVAALSGGDLLLQGGNGGGTNGNGGNVSIDAGVKNGTGSNGRIDIGTSTASTIQIGSITLASGTQTVNIGNNNVAGSITNVTIGAGSSATGGTTTVRSKDDLSVVTSSGNLNLTSTAGTAALTASGNTSVASTAGTLSLTGNGNTSLTSTAGILALNSLGNTTIGTNGVTRATFDNANNLYLGNGVTAAAPNNFVVSGTSSSTTGVAGGSLNLQAGGATVGNANGGNISLDAGTKFGTGVDGNINIGSSHATNIQIGNPTLAAGTQTIAIGNGNTAGGTTNVTIGTGSSATGGTTTVQGKGNVAVNSSNGNVSATASAGTMTITSSGNSSISATAGTFNTSSSGNTTITSTAGTVGFVSSGATTVTTNGTVKATFATTNGLYLGAGVTGAVNPFTISATGGTTGVAGSALTVQGGAAGSSSTGGALNLQGGAGGSTSGAGGIVAIQGGNATAGNSNGGDLTMNAGTKYGTGTDGNIYLGNLNTNTIQIGNNALAAGTQTINIGTNNTAGGTTNLTVGTGSTAAAGTTTVQAKGNVAVNSSNGNIGLTAIAGTISLSSSGNSSIAATAGTFTVTSSGNVTVSSTAGSVGINSNANTTVSTNGTVRATFDTSNGVYFGNGVTATAPSNFTISGTNSSATAVTGGSITVQGGNATVGSANGGNLTLSGGTGLGTGVNGLVVINTPTFSTTINDANCYTGGALVANSCTISTNSVNNSGAILVGFNTTGKTATLPDPTITTAGRIVYLTAANGSQDFTLSVNAGGMGDQIAMRQNTTATMIWNGADWTAAGASSSTTLQSAYDNTMQSAGGAELIVSRTGTTNGLTIRDSALNPVDGTLLSVQTASAAGLFSVNGNVDEYSSDSGAETMGASASTFPTNTWASVGSATVSRYTTAGNYIATGQASVSVAATNTANAGVKNTLTALTANTTYNVSFTTRLLSGTFTDMNVYYSIDGTTASVACATGKFSNTSVWTKVNCTFTAPASGITSANAILIRQTASGTARTFYVDNLSVTIAANYNYATDGGSDDSTNFAANWSFVNATSGAGTATRNTSDGYDASDSATANITTGAANAGIRNNLSINPMTNTLYRITAYVKLASGTFTDFKIRYSRDGSTGSTGNYIDCTDYNTQTITTTAWTKVSCYVTTDSTAATNPYVYFVESTATVRSFSVDAFSMTLSSASTPNVQIGGGLNGGPTTLLTLDRGASAPIASDNDALLGSMYYDTTLGKLQCYEADGWGACGSSPDNVVTISPEYTNAVMHGTGVGTMTSDICSSTLNINDGTSSQPTICGTNETYNFYKWTSPQASAQTYSIYVSYQLPSTFKSFASGQTSIMGRTDSANSSLQYQIYRNDSATGLTACGSALTVSSGAQSSWQIGTATGAADPSTCGFGPSNSIVFKINMTASQNANAYAGNLNFIFSNK